MIFLLLLSEISVSGQSGIIRGKIVDRITNEAIPFATIAISESTSGSISDEAGIFEISGLAAGLYNLEASFIGYESLTVFEIQVTPSRPAFVEIQLKESVTSLDEVEIVASPFNKTEESPVSIRTIGINEIQRSPGGNRDISKVVLSLPGVASTVSFRNDIIIRGGSPGENKFYLDGIEIPTINHFQTQGSSGGPVGMINVDFLKEVDFYSGAFPANRNNALSSIFDFKLKDGREDKVTFNGVIGASDIGAILEGPLSKNSTFLFSVRRSYLQFLFSVLELPFLPTYNDIQFKYKYNFGNKHKLTVLGLGAYDDFKLNTKANETDFQQYFLATLPVSGQWNYTTGIKLESFKDNGYRTYVLSTNKLNSNSKKYIDNEETDDSKLILDYLAIETEYKFRFEDYTRKGNVSLNYGLNLENSNYKTDNFNKIVTQNGTITNNYSSSLNFNKYGAFIQLSHTSSNGKIVSSAGLRTDANTYSSYMSNPIDQISPRLSIAYYFKDNLSFNFNTGIYYQLPPYTVLGYKNPQSEELENQKNGLTYIRSSHIVAGLEYNTRKNAKATVESFYKYYDQYPFLMDNNISLANLGADFGAIGNSPANSNSEGRSYGLEFMYQQKLFKGFYGIAAYTYVRSEFTNQLNQLIPSAWDNRNLVSLTGGKKFKKDWELGVRWLFSGGAPYTPYDLDQSLQKENWDLLNSGILDYEKLNSLRSGNFHQLDIRLDKKIFFNNWSLDIYFDIQNAYNFQSVGQPFLDVLNSENGTPILDPERPDFYQKKFIDNENGTILPSIGVIIEL